MLELLGEDMADVAKLLVQDRESDEEDEDVKISLYAAVQNMDRHAKGQAYANGRQGRPCDADQGS